MTTECYYMVEHKGSFQRFAYLSGINNNLETVYLRVRLPVSTLVIIQTSGLCHDTSSHEIFLLPVFLPVSTPSHAQKWLYYEPKTLCLI